MAGGSEPVREFFSIGDVCELTELKPHVLRYWESQFKFLNPAKNRSGNRVYTRREVELERLRQLVRPGRSGRVRQGAEPEAGVPGGGGE